MAIEQPGRRLERQLRRAIMESLHELVPRFSAHVEGCASCAGFHDWLDWRHREGTNEWYARCPDTGALLTLPFELTPAGDPTD